CGNASRCGMATLVKGVSIHYDDRYLHVELADGRVISTPMSWYSELQQASLQQLSRYRFICQATGIEWPELDYHLNIESMLLLEQQRVAA
ncbi:MAG: DUF2442 domain-containing protein, partial [Gammaproteobacteria bacterium SHHR-1]